MAPKRLLSVHYRRIVMRDDTKQTD